MEYKTTNAINLKELNTINLIINNASDKDFISGLNSATQTIIIEDNNLVTIIFRDNTIQICLDSGLIMLVEIK